MKGPVELHCATCGVLVASLAKGSTLMRAATFYCNNHGKGEHFNPTLGAGSQERRFKDYGPSDLKAAEDLFSSIFK